MHPNPVADALRDCGLRVTAQRLLVLHALGPVHALSADALYLHLLCIGTPLGPGAVRRILADLERAGLVRRHQPARGKARFLAAHFPEHTPATAPAAPGWRSAATP